MKYEIIYTKNAELWKMEKIAKSHGYKKTQDCYWVQIFEDTNGNHIVMTREDEELLSDPCDRLEAILKETASKKAQGAANEKNNYYVIGGQYAAYCYGAAPTLTGAKRLATKNVEYWDNWAGWHIPRIYKAEDICECTNFYGDTRCPIEGASPVAVAYYSNSGRVVWEEC